MRSQKENAIAPLIVIGILALIFIFNQQTGHAVYASSSDLAIETAPVEDVATRTTDASSYAPPAEDKQSPTPQPPVGFQRRCGSRLLPLSNNIIYNAEIASPQAPGNSAEYYISYFTSRPSEEFRVYGAGPNGFFGDADDSGDRPVQRTSPTTPWSAMYYITAFGDTVAYGMLPQQTWYPEYLFAKRSGNDGLLGRGNDDLTYGVAVSPQFSFGTSGNKFDLVANAIVYSIMDRNNNNVLYLIRQDFVDNIPGNGNDVVEVVNPDQPFSNSLSNGYFQTTASKISSWQETIGTAPNTDILTHLVGPGQNGLFEQQSSPTYDDERYTLGGNGINEGNGQLSYDGSFLITIFKSPSSLPPCQSTNFVQLYDLRSIGGPNGRLTTNPNPLQVPLPAPSNLPPGACGPLPQSIDVDGPYRNAQGQQIAGSLAVYYQYDIPTPSQTIGLVFWTNTGPDGRFFSGDEQPQLYQTGPTDSISTMQLKENKIALNGIFNSRYNIQVLNC